MYASPVHRELPSHTDNKGTLDIKKICKAWTKKSGRSQRQDFEDVFTEPIKQRFNELLPSFDFVTTDIVAMFQLCGASSCRLR